MEIILYRISIIIAVVTLFMYLLLNIHVHEYVYFSDIGIVMMIFINHRDYLKCNLEMIISELEFIVYVDHVSCTSNNHTFTIFVLLSLSFFAYKALGYSHFLCKPLMFFILQSFLSIIIIISFPENISKTMIMMLLLEFQLVNLFYNTILVTLQIIIVKIFSFLCSSPDKDGELFLI